MQVANNQSDLDGLINLLIPAAQKLLESHKGFRTFGGSVDNDGQVSLAASMDDGTIDVGLRQSALSGRIRAIGICSDVKTTHHDAIHVRLEHRDGRCVLAFLPYQNTDTGYRYGEIWFEPGSATIFI